MAQAITDVIETTQQQLRRLSCNCHLFISIRRYRLHNAKSNSLLNCAMRDISLLDGLKSHYGNALSVIVPKRENWVHDESELLRADICWFIDISETDQGVGAGILGQT